MHARARTHIVQIVYSIMFNYVVIDSYNTTYNTYPEYSFENLLLMIDLIRLS